VLKKRTLTAGGDNHLSYNWMGKKYSKWSVIGFFKVAKIKRY